MWGILFVIWISNKVIYKYYEIMKTLNEDIKTSEL